MSAAWGMSASRSPSSQISSVNARLAATPITSMIYRGWSALSGRKNVSMTAHDSRSTQAKGLARTAGGEVILLDFQATTPLDPKLAAAMRPWIAGASNVDLHGSTLRSDQLAISCVSHGLSALPCKQCARAEQEAADA